MFGSFLAPFIVASVVLVPRGGSLEKKQAEIPQEQSQYKSSDKSKKEDKDGVIVLRKVKKEKIAKNKKGKKSKEGAKTEFDDENLDDIYKKERQYFDGKVSRRKQNPNGVKGALASIPSAVANSIAKNLADAKKARTTPAPTPVVLKPVEQSADQLLNVEDTIQEKRKTSSEDPKKKGSEAKLKKTSAIVVSAKKFDQKPKVDKQAQIKNELQEEVQLVEVEQIVSEKPSSKKRSPASTEESPKKILKKVEAKYISHFVKIEVKSEVTQALLEKTKTYSGNLFIAPEGRFKMEVQQPNKHMLLMNGKNIWVVDYPLDETQDKVQILHSKSSKNLKNQAFLSIFMGVGNLEKTFKIESSDKKNDEITYKLIPKEKDEQVERVELKVDDQAELITAITFWDSLGNKTHLRFTDQNFEDKVPKDVFKFKPPKDASITYL